MQDGLFDNPAGTVGAESVLMSLNPEYYELIWARLKRHEFRRRFPTGRPMTWYVYLTAPTSRLAAIIDLGEAVVGPPEQIGSIAEQARAGNGDSVFEYLRDRVHGYALPIHEVREHEGFTAEQLKDKLGGFHPPQGYTLVANHPQLAAVCTEMGTTTQVRRMTVTHPAGAC